MTMDALDLLLLTPAVLALLLALRLRTRLVRARQRLADADRLAAARARCLSLAAQELRGPGLALLAELTKEQSAAAREAGRPATIEGVAQQLLRLADDLSQFAGDPATRALHEAPNSMGPVVDAAIAAVAGQIRPARRHWQVDPALRNLTIRADRRALEGALAALLRRAARHSRDGDSVVLRYVEASETVAIVVEDEGDGLHAEDIGAEAALGGGTRGLDLGLSLARSLAAAHGGDIRLESAPGIGARAWLTLPRTRLLQAA